MRVKILKMAGGKWGESFLKSGFPLEHLVLVIFKNLQWDCHPNFEYTRLNREKHEEWFEVDLVAKCPRFNETTQLSMLLECKYHDPSRYWFFLPHESSGRWLFDDRALNCAPYQTLRHPRANTILREAPLSSHAIVVAQDGAKQDNAAHTAIQQVVNGFVPCALDWAFGYNIDYTNVMDPRDELRFEPGVDALIPVVVTNADLFRLRPEIKDLDVIRKASGPPDVAESVGWTWCYHDVPSRLADQNMEAIRRHLRKVPELVYRFPDISNGIYGYAHRPNWIAVVNVRSLEAFIKNITIAFTAAEMIHVRSFLRVPPVSPKKSRRKASKQR